MYYGVKMRHKYNEFYKRIFFYDISVKRIVARYIQVIT